MLASAIIFFSGVFLATTTFLCDLGVDTYQVNNHNAIQPQIERHCDQEDQFEQHYDQDDQLEVNYYQEDQISMEETFIQATSSESGSPISPIMTKVKRLLGMIQVE